MKLTNTAVLLLIRLILLKSISQELNLNQNDYQLTGERLEIVRYNKDYLKEASCKTFKYNRTIAVVNFTLTPNVDLANEIEGIVQAYKFMSNEYRFFPMHFGANLCKAFAANVGGMKSGFARCGNVVGCPFLKGIRYYTCNYYPDPSKFPPYIPSGQYKIETQLMHNSQEIMFTNAYITISRPIV